MPEETADYIHIPIRSKGLFVDTSFRTISISDSKGIKAVIGKLKTDPGGSTKVQKYLFAKAKGWTMEKAKSWVKEHKAEIEDFIFNEFGIVNIQSNGIFSSSISETSQMVAKVWTRAFINDLPDAAFAYIESGGKKDESEKTVPRNKRHFPHHNKSVKSGTENNTVDIPHLRNALARVPQSPFGSKAKGHLEAHAKALDIGDRGDEK